MAKTFRCTICNKVSRPEIETDSGDFKHDYYVEDPIDPASFICGECKEAIDLINLDFEDMEEAVNEA